MDHYSVLDIVRDWFGADLDTDLLRHVDDMPTNQVEAFRDYYQEKAGNVTVPPRKPGETRPAYYSTHDPRLRASLLLADRVVAASPFSSILDYDSVVPSLFASDMIQLYQCSSLIDAQLLTLIPSTLRGARRSVEELCAEESTVVAELEALLGRDACRVVADKLGAPKSSLRFERARGSNRLAGIVDTVNSNLQLAIALEEECGHTVQVADLGSALRDATLQRAHVAAASGAAATAVPGLTSTAKIGPALYARDGGGLKVLATLRIPVLGNLPDATMAVLRDDGEAWAEWRASLREGLAIVESIPASVDDWHVVARSVLAEALGPARSNLEGQLKESRILAQSLPRRLSR